MDGFAVPSAPSVALVRCLRLAWYGPANSYVRGAISVPFGRRLSNFNGRMFALDGVIHYLGSQNRGMSHQNALTVWAECMTPLGIIPDDAGYELRFGAENVWAPFATCIACNEKTNYGTYAPK